MTDSMKKFFAYADEHEDVKKKLLAIDPDVDEAAAAEQLKAIAAEAGFAVTDADFSKPEGELTDEQAETASGGGWWNSNKFYSNPRSHKFNVGDLVQSGKYRGCIIKVSETPRGGFFGWDEYTYTVHWTKSQTGASFTWESCNKVETDVYESELCFD